MQLNLCFSLKAEVIFIMKKDIPVFSFIGYSGSGKTTYLEKLIRELKNRKIKIAVLKHDSHDFEIDKEGKDTWKFTRAGADIVSISSGKKMAKICNSVDEFTLEKIIQEIRDVDLIITEGYRAGKAPKIGVLREASGKELSVNLKDLIALVTDKKVETEIPLFDLEDVKSMADFIINKITIEEIPYGIELEEALGIILSLKYNTITQKIDIESSLDRIISEDIIAREMIPPFDRSPLDGYAFNSQDTKGVKRENPVTLRIIEEVAAGQVSSYELKPGEAFKILTGAAIPAGADAVTGFEETEYNEKNVKLFREYMANENIVFAGEDIRKDEKIVSKGFKVTPPLIGLMASLGIPKIEVFEKPVISVINTGSELLDINEELRPGKIRNSGFYTISSYLKREGAVIVNGGCASDKTEDIAKKIRKALYGSDMVITTGGVSVGDYDLVKETLINMGAKILFWKMNIKPGGAVLAALLEGKLILGLSGNPGSAVICLQTLGVPYIRMISGCTNIFTEKVKVHMYKDYNKKSPGGRFLRGRLIIEDGKAYFEERGSQKNGSISSLVECDLLGIVKAGSTGIKKDEIIEAYKI